MALAALCEKIEGKDKDGFMALFATHKIQKIQKIQPASCQREVSALVHAACRARVANDQTQIGFVDQGYIHFFVG